MKFENGQIKSMALADRVTVEISMSRRKFVECNSDEDVARIMGLDGLTNSYGSDFITADIDFNLVLPTPEIEEVEPPTSLDDEDSKPEDEEIERR